MIYFFFKSEMFTESLKIAETIYAEDLEKCEEFVELIKNSQLINFRKFRPINCNKTFKTTLISTLLPVEPYNDLTPIAYDSKNKKSYILPSIPAREIVGLVRDKSPTNSQYRFMFNGTYKLDETDIKFDKIYYFNQCDYSHKISLESALIKASRENGINIGNHILEKVKGKYLKNNSFKYIVAAVNNIKNPEVLKIKNLEQMPYSYNKYVPLYQYSFTEGKNIVKGIIEGSFVNYCANSIFVPNIGNRTRYSKSVDNDLLKSQTEARTLLIEAHKKQDYIITNYDKLDILNSCLYCKPFKFVNIDRIDEDELYVCIDVNSLYPYVMKVFEINYGIPTIMDTIDKNGKNLKKLVFKKSIDYSNLTSLVKSKRASVCLSGLLKQNKNFNKYQLNYFGYYHIIYKAASIMYNMFQFLETNYKDNVIYSNTDSFVITKKCYDDLISKNPDLFGDKIGQFKLESTGYIKFESGDISFYNKQHGENKINKVIKLTFSDEYFNSFEKVFESYGLVNCENEVNNDIDKITIVQNE